MNYNGCERKSSWPNLAYSSSIYLEALRKMTKTLNLCRWVRCMHIGTRPFRISLQNCGGKREADRLLKDWRDIED
jgi:hypothetical protein